MNKLFIYSMLINSILPDVNDKLQLYVDSLVEQGTVPECEIVIGVDLATKPDICVIKDTESTEETGE